MPRATHVDNGKIRLVFVDEYGCPCCGSHVRVSENDAYQFLSCVRTHACGYEETIDLCDFEAEPHDLCLEEGEQ